MDKFDIDLIIRRTVRGIVALVSKTFFLNLVSFGAFLVITSKLAKSEFGVYIVVIAIQRVISFFADFGLGAALIQKKEDLKQEDLTTFFTIQAGVTFGIFLLILVFIQPIADFFRLNDQGKLLLLVLVFTIFLSSFKVIPSILLERTINFSKLVFPQIIESLVFNIVLVALVLGDYGINAFSFAFLLSSFIGIPIFYLVSPWRFNIGISTKSLRFLKYGIRFQAKNILATVKDDLLTVILPLFLTFSEISNIGFAQRIAFYAYRYIVDSVTKVTFSTYARAQSDLKFLKIVIEKSLFFVSASMMPILFGLIIVSFYLIDFFPNWKNKWEPAYFSIIFFSLNAVVSALSGILVNVLDATGKVKITLRLMIIWTFMIWILTPFFIYLYGYNGVSLASFLVTLTIVYTTYLVKKIVEFSFLKSIYKPLIATIFMTIVVFILSRLIVRDFLTLIFVILIGATVYLTLLFGLAGREIKDNLARFGFKS